MHINCKYSGELLGYIKHVYQFTVTVERAVSLLTLIDKHFVLVISKYPNQGKITRIGLYCCSPLSSIIGGYSLLLGKWQTQA